MNSENPNLSFQYQEKNRPQIKLTLELGKSEFHTFKAVLSPSHAVNPPAIQYIRGKRRHWGASANVTDKRAEDLTRFIWDLLTRAEPRYVQNLLQVQRWAEHCVAQMDKHFARTTKYEQSA